MRENKVDEKLKNFLEEIEKICKAHNISISHEDEHGGFLFIEYNEECMEWFKCGCWDRVFDPDEYMECLKDVDKEFV